MLSNDPSQKLYTILSLLFSDFSVAHWVFFAHWDCQDFAEQLISVSLGVSESRDLSGFTSRSNLCGQRPGALRSWLRQCLSRHPFTSLFTIHEQFIRIFVNQSKWVRIFWEDAFKYLEDFPLFCGKCPSFSCSLHRSNESKCVEMLKQHETTKYLWFRDWLLSSHCSMQMPQAFKKSRLQIIRKTVCGRVGYTEDWTSSKAINKPQPISTRLNRS